MADLFTDTFTEGNWNDINEVGFERETWWEYHPAAGQRWYIVNNRTHNTGSGVARCTTNPGTADYAVTFTWAFFTDIAGAKTGPIIRYNSASNNGYIAYYTGGTLYLAKLVSGVETVLASKALSLSYGSNPNPVNHPSRLEARGTSIGLWVDGTLQLQVTDTSIPASGYAGMRSLASADAYLGLQFDDYVLTNSLLLPEPSVLPVHVKIGGSLVDAGGMKLKVGGSLVDVTIGG